MVAGIIYKRYGVYQAYTERLIKKYQPPYRKIGTMLSKQVIPCADAPQQSCTPLAYYTKLANLIINYCKPILEQDVNQIRLT
jgi:hypothetical protein